MDGQRIAKEIGKMPPSERKEDDRIECLNGDGSTRMAYRFQKGPLKGKVIKIAMMGTAREENKHKMQTWMKFKDTKDRQLFCPIRYADHNSYRWIVMDYAEPISGAAEALKSKIHSVKLKRAAEDSYDITMDNIGKHKSHGIVIFDYPWAYDLEKYE